MPTDPAAFAKRMLHDAASTSVGRGWPARRAFARRVLAAVFDRAERECPELLRRMTQENLHAVHRDALAGNAEALAYLRESAAIFRADGFDAPPLPGDDA